MFYALLGSMSSLSGIDVLVGKSLECKIKESLGEQIFKKIQEKSLERDCREFTCTFGAFQRLDIVLRELFGNDVEQIEKQIVNQIVTFEKIANAENRINIVDPKLVKLILEAVGDEDKMNILLSVVDEARTASEISRLSNIPQTSGYRKIKELIQNGMLIPQKFSTVDNKNKAKKYKSIFKQMTIEIRENKVAVGVILCKESLKDSDIIGLYYNGIKRFI